MHDRSFWRLVLRWSWLILLAAAVGAFTAYAISTQLPREYEAETLLIVGSLTETDPAEQVGYQQLANTYADLVRTPLVLVGVASAVGYEGDLEDLRNRVSADALGSGGIIRVTATSASPEEAASIAASTGLQLSQISRGTGPVGTELAIVIEEARVPDDPSWPRPTLNAVVGAALGVLLGLLIVFLIEPTRSRTAGTTKSSPALPQFPESTYPPRGQAPPYG